MLAKLMCTLHHQRHLTISIVVTNRAQSVMSESASYLFCCIGKLMSAPILKYLVLPIFANVLTFSAACLCALALCLICVQKVF